MSKTPFWFLSLGILFFALAAQAGLDEVEFPVAELGNCESQEACFAYCEEPGNFDACMAFAQEKDLLSEEEVAAYEQAGEAIAQGGPGGCTSQVACETYCGDLNNIDECLAFAQASGMMGEEELAQAKKVQAALDAGYSMPGGCTNEASCEAYCSDASHMEECLAFAQAAGFMSGEELEEAKKMMGLMQSGATPGGCTSQETCEAYCEDPANGEECLSFAVEAGMMTQEESDIIRESGMKKEFVGPGGCTSKDACEAYCSDEANREACEAFAQEQGFESEEELEMMEEFVGPGGCTTKDGCEAFCADEVNRETCEAFFGGGEMTEQPSEFEDEEEMLEREWDGKEMYEDVGEVQGEWDETWEGGIEVEGGEWEGGDDWKMEGFQYEGDAEGDDGYEYQYDYDEAEKYEQYEYGGEGEIEGFYPEDFSVEGADSRDQEPGAPDFFEVSPPLYEGGVEYDGGGGEYRGESGGGDTSGSGGDSSGGGGGGDEGGAPQSLGPAIDAGFVESIKRFFYRAGLKARGVLTL